MPRPKGSKNKKTVIAAENLEAKIAAVQADVEKLNTELKAKKAERKELLKDKAAILAAVEASGKSVEEILDLLM